MSIVSLERISFVLGRQAFRWVAYVRSKVQPKCATNQGQYENYAHDLFSTRNAFMQENTGWHIDMEGKKLTAKAKQALLKLKFQDMKLTRITFCYMKSYGKQWGSSRVKASVMAMTNGLEVEVLKRDELVGWCSREPHI